VFYDNETEQAALFEFLGKYMTFKNGGIPDHNIYINDPGISWTAANAPYTISTTNNLSGAITLSNCSDSTINTEKLESNIHDSITAAISPKEKKAYAAAHLDDNSDEGGYSCLTAYVPRPSKIK
jgi:hypothetical protein